MRKTFLTAGVFCLLIAWAGPLPELAGKAFFGHMIMHMLVVAMAAPLLSFGLINTPFDLSEKFPAFFAPVTAAMVELVVVWAWHAPYLHHYARHDTAGLIVEQGMFLFAGIWVWMSSFSGSETGKSEKIGAGIIGLLLTSMHMTLLGALLNLSNRILYPHHQGIGSLAPLDDQQLGGAIMLVIGGISYLGGGLYLTFRFLQMKKVTTS